MKIWCSWNVSFSEDNIWLGIGGYKHHKDHKWNGWTLHLYLFKWTLTLHYVSDWAEYNKRMTYRYSDRLKKLKRKKDEDN